MSLSESEPLVLIYSTFPDVSAAETAARALVGERLAACANILPAMISVYPWKGAVERDEEVVALFKTRASLTEQAMAAVERAHPYEVPAVLVLPLGPVSAAYGQWLLEETRPRA